VTSSGRQPSIRGHACKKQPLVVEVADQIGMGDARAPEQAPVALQREEDGDFRAIGELVMPAGRMEAGVEALAEVVQRVGGRRGVGRE
jgi:hypothetical protein